MSRISVNCTFLAVLLLIPLSGCLDMKELTVNYTLDSSLSGSMEVVYGGIGSDESDVEAQKKEMAGFYQDLPELTAEHSFMWGLLEKEIVLENKTDLGCDVIIKGKIEDFLRSLAPLMDDGVYEIQRTKDSFSCSIQSSDMMSDDMGFVVNIAFAGKIISHNAHSFDAEKQVMQWNGAQMGESGIQFKLHIE